MMTIRTATRDDLTQWLDMRAALWPTDDPMAHLTELNVLIPDAQFYALVADINGQLVAFLEAYIRRYANGCDSMPVPFLEGIWVHEDHRQHGVGRAMLAAFEQWVRERGFDEIGSDTEIDNLISIHAHQSWGFEETERVVYFRKRLP